MCLSIGNQNECVGQIMSRDKRRRRNGAQVCLLCTYALLFCESSPMQDYWQLIRKKIKMCMPYIFKNRENVSNEMDPVIQIEVNATISMLIIIVVNDSGPSIILDILRED